MALASWREKWEELFNNTNNNQLNTKALNSTEILNVKLTIILKKQLDVANILTEMNSNSNPQFSAR